MSSSAPPLKSRHTLFADFINVLTGKLSHVAISLTIGIATARIWGAEGRGLIAVVLVWPTIVVTLFELGAIRALPYLIGKKIMPLKDSGRVVTTIWAFSSTLAICATLLALHFILDEDLTWPWLVCVSLWIPVFLFTNYTLGFALSVQRPRHLTSTIFIKGPITIGLILTAGVALGYDAAPDAWLYISAHALGFAATSIYGARLMVKYTSLGLTTNIGQIGSNILATIRFGISGVVMHLNQYADILLLSLPFFLVPRSDIGNYTIGVAAARLLWQIPASLGLLMHSRGTIAEDSDRFSRQIASTARGSLIVAIPFMILIVIVAPYAFPLVYGSEFSKSGTIVQILSPAIFAFFAARIYVAGFEAHGKIKPMTLIMGGAAIANILLNIWWIQLWGIYGAAWASSVTFPMGAILLGIAYARSSDMSLGDLLIPKMADLNPVISRLKKLTQKLRRSPRNQSPQ